MLSGGEVLVIFLVILVLFGSKNIPDIAKGLAKGLGEIKKATDEIKQEIVGETTLVNDFNTIKKTLQDSVKTPQLNDLANELNKNIDISNEMKDISNSISLKNELNSVNTVADLPSNISTDKSEMAYPEVVEEDNQAKSESSANNSTAKREPDAQV